MKYSTAIFLLPFLASLGSASPFHPEKSNDIQTRNKKVCLLPLSDNYLEPSDIIPISAKSPNTAFGDTNKPIITPSDYCSIFNFEIPSKYASNTCTLKFILPDVTDAEDTYTFSGPGSVDFEGYNYGVGANKKTTTYNNQPGVSVTPPGAPSLLKPGSVYTISTGACGAPVQKEGEPEQVSGGGSYKRGDKNSGLVSGKLCSKDTTLEFKQDDHNCPIGLFIEIS